MIITFFRSSSAKTYKWCEHKYFCEYVLGIRDEDANKAAHVGTIVHKALELYAQAKKAEQEHLKSFEDEHFGNIEVEKIKSATLSQVVKKCYNYYSNYYSQFEWDYKDWKKAISCAEEAVTMCGGKFHPLNMNILDTEKFFDIIVDEDWAKYRYTLPNGNTIDGNLRLMGTIDLVTEPSDGVIEVVDWKTGQRKDWSTGVVMDESNLFDDIQLRLYHYVLCQLYPKHDSIFVTINYLRDGGPYSLFFSRSDIPDTLKQIRSLFEAIRKNDKPKLTVDFRCNRFCHIGKQGLCKPIHDSINLVGISNTMAAYSKDKSDYQHLFEYGSGGGRIDKKD